MKVVIVDSDMMPKVRKVECSELVISWLDGGELIIDSKEVVPLKKVIRVIGD